MSTPELQISPAPAPDASADALVIALPTLESAPEALEAFPGLSEALNAIAFTGAKNAFDRIYLPSLTDTALAVVGLGSAPSADTVREAVGAAARLFTGIDALAIALPTNERHWQAALDGASLGVYAYEASTRESDADRAKRRRATRVTVHAEVPEAEARDAVARATAAARGIALVKDLVSLPGNDLTPAELAARAESASASLPIDVTVWDEEALERDAFGGILGVGKGAANPPRLVRLDYAPTNAQRHISLVGKGITYDTGGLSLKPAASMVGMHEDMAGAAVVLAVITAAAELELPVRLTGWLACAENALSASSQRPGDILTIADGTTVEVTNTDAEGRLVLADALVAASREHPDAIVDIATLTGAILIALGTRISGVMGDEAETDAYLSAARSTGDPAWPLPMPEYMNEELKSRVADLRNANVGNRYAGTLFAALFLRRFVGKVSDADDAPRIPWIHLDIAGSAMSTKVAHGFTDRGPTGAAVRALLSYISADRVATTEGGETA